MTDTIRFYAYHHKRSQESPKWKNFQKIAKERGGSFTFQEFFFPRNYIAKFVCIEVSTIHNICSPKGREEFTSRLAIFQKIISFGNTRLPLVNIIDRSSYVIISSFHSASIQRRQLTHAMQQQTNQQLKMLERF